MAAPTDLNSVIASAFVRPSVLPSLVEVGLHLIGGPHPRRRRQQQVAGLAEGAGMGVHIDIAGADKRIVALAHGGGEGAHEVHMGARPHVPPQHQRYVGGGGASDDVGRGDGGGQVGGGLRRQA